jgi:POT family proton-dependent oligopeptide transporter
MAAPTASAEPGVDFPLTPFEERVGHHPGLFALFFAEMWERFSYYGMRALLIFYMTKDFLDYSDERAYSVYGAYTALVYMTPFIGGLVADRLLGQRAAVIIGGSLMALGHLIMTIEDATAFFVALALLICGNGFFKPNIGTILGRLYGGHRLTHKKDGAFTIFYMGVNLGAAIAPLVCVYVGENYGWHYGFGLATIGMMIGLAIFVAPTLVTQLLIGVGATLTAGSLVWIGSQQDVFVLAANVLVAVALLVAMVFSLWALANSALPAEIGQPRTKEGFGRNVAIVLAITAVAVAVFAWLCEHGDIAGNVLIVVGIAALGYVIFEAVRVTKIERERLFVILIMAFFSMLFWAFFEQAGSSISLFTDRNVDRVTEERVLTEADVGTELDLVLTQEQVGYPIEEGGAVFTLDRLDALRGEAHERGESDVHQRLTVTAAHVGMAIGGSEVAAGMFQATNPIFILLFGLLFTALWGGLAKRGIEPSTPIKFVFGLAQLGAGFAVLWFAAENADARGMVGMSWLILAYLLHTTGELCLSPVGLSMVSKMAPARMVATMMGAWYLATAFSQYLAGIIATFTGIEEGGGGSGAIPLPTETLGVYADVFGKIAIASFVATLLLLVLSPLVKRWMHEGAPAKAPEPPKGPETPSEPAAA